MTTIAAARPNPVLLSLCRDVILPALARALHAAVVVAAVVASLTALLGR